SGLDSISLSDSEARRLLSAILREFVQMNAEEEHDNTSPERPLLSKRCSGLSTCVLGKLSQDLHKLQTFPRTNVGAGTPGRKRNVLAPVERETGRGGSLGTLGTLGQRFSLDHTLQKRSCNTATCVTHRLADFLSRSGGMGNAHFVPTNVGAKAFGRRRRTAH
ncbi:calcitonin-like, partial [Eucyclogobius newberryi]|uniref:calcitonin-like n=1 Tax=Eucyclogobius newberryi TaxID=166745 RepID=UPI003B5AF0D6